MSEKVFIVDESGHVGVNYADPQQPFHVAAGWLIASEHLERARELVSKHMSPKGVAMKAAQRLRSSAGRKHVLGMLEGLAGLPALPFYIVMERRFSLVGKIVDVFLDPDHHAGAAWLPMSEAKKRKSLTERLCDELPDRILGIFAETYRAPTVEGFSLFLQELIAERRARSDALLVRSFASALEAVERIVEQENYAGEHGPHGSFAALNVPALVHLLRKVDRYMEFRSQRYSVVHDRNDEFRKAMEFTTRQMARRVSEPELCLTDGTVLRSALIQLDGFTMKERHEESLLEAADTLASTVTYLCKKALQPKALRESLFEDLARLTLPALLHDDPPFAGAYAHDDTIARCLMAALGKELPPRRSE